MGKSVRFLFAAASTLMGVVLVAPAQAGPLSAGSGVAIRDAVPETTAEVRWGGGHGGGFHRGGFHGGGFHGGGFRRHAQFHHHRHWGRPAHRRVVVVRPGFVRAGFYGPACVWRPAKVVITSYGERFVPARRVCGI